MQLSKRKSIKEDNEESKQVKTDCITNRNESVTHSLFVFTGKVSN